MWNAIGFVTSGFTLVAFIVAVVAWLYRSSNLKAERLIRTAPDKKRAELVSQALEFFNVDSAGLTKQQQFELAVQQIGAKVQRFQITAVVIVVVAILTTVVSVYALTRPDPTINGAVTETPATSVTPVKYRQYEDAFLASVRIVGVPDVFTVDGTKIVRRDTTDEDILTYLDTVAKEAELVSEVWEQLQRELVETSIGDTNQWDGLRAKYRMLPPPNTRHFANLAHFYDLIAELSKQDTSENASMSRFMQHTEAMLEARDNAVATLATLVNEEGDGTTVDTANRQKLLKNFGKTIEELINEAAALKALAVSVRRKLA